MRSGVRHTGTAVALAAIATGVVIAGCGSGGPSTTKTSLVQKHQPKRLYVYVSLPHSGPQAPQAASVLNGVTLAFDQAHKQAGPYKLVLKSLDDGGPAPRGWTASATAANARRAAVRPDTVLYIGELDSGASAVSIPILNQALIPQISPGSPATYLTTDGKRFRPTGEATFLRLVPYDTDAAYATLRALVRLGCTRTAVVDDRSGRDLVAAMRANAKEFKVQLDTIGKSTALPTTTAAIASYIEQAHEAGECVFYSGVASTSALTLTRSLQTALPSSASVVGSSQICDASWAKAVAPPPPASSDAGKLGTGTDPGGSTTPTATTSAITATNGTTAGTTPTTSSTGTAPVTDTTSTSAAATDTTPTSTTTGPGTTTTPGQGTVTSAGLWCTSPTPNLSSSKLGRGFISAYRKAFDGNRPDLPAIFGYEAMEAGLQAIDQLGASADSRASLLDELHTQIVRRSALGTGGNVTFDENGQSSLAGYSLYRVEPGGGLSYDATFSTASPAHG